MFLKKSVGLAFFVALVAGIFAGAALFTATAAGSPPLPATGLPPVAAGGAGAAAALVARPQSGGQAVTVSFTVLDEDPGDVNGDGKVDVGDSILILRRVVGLEQFDGAQELMADLNGDGKVDVGDAIMLLRMVVGLE